MREAQTQRIIRRMPKSWSSSRVHERALTKLARTFGAQMEALKRYRTGGEQKVVVQHVHVSDGGQAAVVGNVNQNRGAANE